MNEKIEKFSKMSISEQKRILLVLIKDSIDKSEGLNKLYNLIKSIETNNEFDSLKNEFISIYTF